MKIVFSDLFAPANETISHSNIPWRRAPCQTGNGAATGKGHIFEMLSNGLGIAKIMEFAYKTIEDLLKGSPANLLKVYGKQICHRTIKGRVIYGTLDGFFRFASGLAGMNFLAGSLMRPFDSKRRSRLRQTMSLRTPFGCLQSHCLQTSWEMKRLLLPGCAAIIRLTISTSSWVTDRLLYVMIGSIAETIKHQNLERNLFLKKNHGRRTILKWSYDCLWTVTNSFTVSNSSRNIFSYFTDRHKRVLQWFP